VQVTHSSLSTSSSEIACFLVLYQKAASVPYCCPFLFLSASTRIMDAQYPFASRDDIWRVFEELKELHAAQFEQAERIARLERRRDEDARLKSVWGPLSPFPSSVGGAVPTGMSSLLSAYSDIWSGGWWLITCLVLHRACVPFKRRHIQRF
jgi:hypothetical protein